MSTPEPQRQEGYRRRKKKDMLSRIKKKAQAAKHVRDQKIDDIIKWRKQYNGEWDSLNRTEQGKWFYVRKTFQHIQRMISELLVAYFRQKDFADLEPLHPSRTANVASDIGSILMNYYWEMMQPWDILHDAFEAGCRDSTTVVKLTWDKILRGRRVLRNQPRGDAIPIENVLWDPTAKTDDQIRWMIHERKTTKSELYQRQAEGIYQNVNDIGDTGDANLRETRPSREEEEPISVPEDEEEVIIWEYWGLLQTKPRLEVEEARKNGDNIPPGNVVITVSEDAGVLLRPPEQNPYRRLRQDMSTYESIPLFLGKAKPKDHSTWGRSIAGDLRSAQREINKLRNQRRQNVDLMMGTKAIVNSQRNINHKKLCSPTFAGVVEADGPVDERSIRWFSPPDMSAATVREEQIVNRDMQQTSGVTDPAMGVSPKGRQTATEISSLMQQSNLKIGTIPESFSGTLIRPMLRFLLDCIRNFATPQEASDILGSYTKPPPLKQILGDRWKVKVKAGQDVTSQVQQSRELQQAMQTLEPLAQTDPGLFQVLYQSILKELLPMLGVEEGAVHIRRREQMVRARGQSQGAGRRQQQQPRQRGRRQTRRPSVTQRSGPSPQEQSGVRG